MSSQQAVRRSNSPRLALINFVIRTQDGRQRQQPAFAFRLLLSFFRRNENNPRIVQSHMSIFIILLSLAIWGVVHSITASYSFKDGTHKVVGDGSMRFYRLAYNAFSFVSFLPILYLSATLPNQPAYEVPGPWRFVMMAGQAISVLLLFAAFLQTDALFFVGLRQLLGAGEQAPGQLVTRGLYSLVRHPLYTFSMSFLWLSPSVSQNSLTLYIGITLYFVIGAYFEERKLLRDFGKAYAEYKRKTPMLIPLRLFGEK